MLILWSKMGLVYIFYDIVKFTMIQFLFPLQNSEKNKIIAKYINFDAILRRVPDEIRYHTQ